MKEESRTANLLSSNLMYLQGIIEVVEKRDDVTAVLKAVPMGVGGRHANTFDPYTASPDPMTCVDVVLGGGSVWVKVVAKRAQSIHLVWAGKGNYGKKCIVSQAKCLKKIAALHRVNYRSPQICLNFRSGLTKEVKDALESLHFKVEISPENGIVPVSEDILKKLSNLDDSYSDISEHSDDSYEDSAEAERCHHNPANNTSLGLRKCNLDITALISLVSNLNTRRGCDSEFKSSKILKQQAKDELENPTLPSLNEYIEDTNIGILSYSLSLGKELYACRTALESFQTILNTVGGPKEKCRGLELIRRVIVIDDKHTERSNGLQIFGHIKDRAKKIFGTGDYLKAVTITANCSFVRAAHNQNVDFVVHLIKPRALSEQKE